MTELRNTLSKLTLVIAVKTGEDGKMFGSVTSGLETADKIFAAAGGQELPADPVVMNRVFVGTPAPGGSPAAASNAPSRSP